MNQLVIIASNGGKRVQRQVTTSVRPSKPISSNSRHSTAVNMLEMNFNVVREVYD